MSVRVIRPLAWVTAGLSVFATTLAFSSYRTATASGATPALPAATAATTAAGENPAVAPGLVKWHRSFADARAAAEKSGRPVLVFHMMGQLDRQFC
jgi:hypothetical protein